MICTVYTLFCWIRRARSKIWTWLSALAAIETALDVNLSRTPFIYRKAHDGHGLRRELIIPFGATGYVALYEIAEPGKVVVLAIRHQREEDYH